MPRGGRARRCPSVEVGGGRHIGGGDGKVMMKERTGDTTDMSRGPLRVGIVGTDSSHVDEYVRLLNTDRRVPGCRVTAVAGDDDARLDALARAGALDVTCSDTPGLLPYCDAVIVADRRGALHARHAGPALDAGKPVFVDKPLAEDLRDAHTMLGRARAGGAALTSFSALRWHDGARSMRAELRRRRPRSLVVSGPADPSSPYGGLAFYGIHSVELACRVADGPAARPVVTREPNSVRMRVRIGGVPTEIRLWGPGDGNEYPFHVEVEWEDGTTAVDLPLGRDYLLPGLRRFLEMARGGPPPLTDTELLRPVALLAALRAHS